MKFAPSAWTYTQTETDTRATATATHEIYGLHIQKMILVLQLTDSKHLLLAKLPKTSEHHGQ